MNMYWGKTEKCLHLSQSAKRFVKTVRVRLKYLYMNLNKRFNCLKCGILCVFIGCPLHLNGYSLPQAFFTYVRQQSKV